jgi:hypothetical protein
LRSTRREEGRESPLDVRRPQARERDPPERGGQVEPDVLLANLPRRRPDPHAVTFDPLREVRGDGEGRASRRDRPEPEIATEIVELVAGLGGGRGRDNPTLTGAVRLRPGEGPAPAAASVDLIDGTLAR